MSDTDGALLWRDPDYEEFQCAGCFGPAFRRVTGSGHRGRLYCSDACARAAAYRVRVARVNGADEVDETP